MQYKLLVKFISRTVVTVLIFPVLLMVSCQNNQNDKADPTLSKHR